MNAHKVNHIGIVVRDLDEVVKLYRDGLGLTLTHTEEVAEQEVRIAFLPIGDTQIELVQPITTSSGISVFLEKRGEGLHHICLEVDDIEAALADLTAQGYRLIDEKPRAGAHGHKVAFMHPKATHGVLIELTQPTRDSH